MLVVGYASHADDRGCAGVAVRWPQIPGPVQTMPAVMRGVLLQDRPQVARPGDQHPIGDLGPGRAHQAIRRGSFRSVRELTGAIGAFIDACNDRCQPFTWTKDDDQLLAKIKPSKN